MIDPTDSTVDRRGFLRLGGATLALSAVVAACGGANEGAGPEGVASAGTRPPLATTTSATVTDVVLLRTATSLHYNAMDVVDLVTGISGVDPAIVEMATKYRGLLQGQADALAAATNDAGGQPYEQKNAAVDERVIQPAASLLGASDTPAADAARLLHAVASLAAATHQAFVAQFVAPALRQAAMSIGVVHAQVAAALAGVISPENIVPEAEISSSEPAGVPDVTATTVAAGLPSTSVAATATSAAAAAGVPDVVVYMVPSAFGALSPTQVVLGKAGVEDATKRQQVNIETPSLNSMVY